MKKELMVLAAALIMGIASVIVIANGVVGIVDGLVAGSIVQIFIGIIIMGFSIFNFGLFRVFRREEDREGYGWEYEAEEELIECLDNFYAPRKPEWNLSDTTNLKKSSRSW